MEFVKNIIWYLVVPVTCIGLLVVLTGLLLVQRSELRPESTSEWYPGVGFQKPHEINTSQWFPYYGGGEGVDTVIAHTDTSLRVSTGGDGGWYGARTDVSNVSFTDSSIAFSFRVHDWNEVDRLLVLFSSDQSFASYYGLNLKNYFSNPTSGEWHSVILDKSEFSVIEGEPSWNQITDVALRVVPVPGVSTRVWFDDFMVVPKNNLPAVVTFTFDDGFASVMEAKNVMDIYGYQGTAYIIPEFLDTEKYLTQAQVDELASDGWDISGHGKDNLVDLNPPDVDTQLAAMSEYLKAGEYKGANHFAYPNGGYNDSVQSQVLEYFESARTIDGFSQPSGYIYPKNVNAVTISSVTPVIEIIDEINQAVGSGGWLILVWHDFTNDPQADVEYHIRDFEWVLDYLSQNNVEVLPYSVAYDRFTVAVE